MKIVKVKTGISIQPYRVESLTEERLEKGLKDGSIRHVQGDIYEETDQTYSTRDMEAQAKKVVKKKVTRRKKKAADEEE
jgi:hypothetical protein